MPKQLTSGRVYGGPTNKWGLPFKKLPQEELTPESFLNEQIATGRQQIQNRFNLAWNEINRSKKFIGANKSSRLLQELHVKAKQEMLQFNQQAQVQLERLNNINRLAEQGLIQNADELKARMVYGPNVARSIYPQTKEEDIPTMFGKLDLYANRIEKRLAQFRRKKERIPSLLLGKKKEGVRPGKIQVWDIDAGKPELNKVTGKMEYWRDATPEEIQERALLIREESNVAKRKKELLSISDVSRRIMQPGTKGGTFNDKIAQSIRPQQAVKSKSKVIRQRNKRTGQERISYDGGKTWQIVSG